MASTSTQNTCIKNAEFTAHSTQAGGAADTRPPSWRAFKASGVGFELGIYVALGFFFGRWLDGRLGTEPTMMMVFVLFGVVIGIVSMIRATRSAWPTSDPEKNQITPPAARAMEMEKHT